MNKAGFCIFVRKCAWASPEMPGPDWPDRKFSAFSAKGNKEYGAVSTLPFCWLVEKVVGLEVET